MVNILATTPSGGKTEISAQRMAEFRSGLRGELLTGGDEEYDRARAIWNGMIDRRPALIARCAGTNDVVQSVNFAREHDLLIAVKGGGHNVAGNAVCDSGLMIDLSLMRTVQVNAEHKTARVQGGCLLSDVDVATSQHGLAVSAGIVSHTGVAGLTLGGGFGWISRRHGLTIDNLLSAEVVTADGNVLTASKDENADLFWGLRGGGGNFGIVTSFEFRCAEIGAEVFSGLIVKPFAEAKKYIQFHSEYVRTLPDEMTVWMVVRHAPPLPFLPESIHGQMVVVVPWVYLGEREEGEKLIKPIRDFGKSHGEGIGMHPWAGWQAGFDGLVPHGARNYWKSHHVKALSDDCIDKIIEYAEKMPTSECEVFVPHMEGAPSRVPETETAFAHRKTPFVLNIHTRWQKASDDERCLAWAKNFFEDTKEFANGVYVNFLSDEGDDRVREAYTQAVWDHLVQVKNKYDPANRFRLNQNIAPSA